MHTPRTILRGLLIAGAWLAFGVVASNRAVVPAPIRRDQPAAIDPAIMSQIARAQAAVALSQSSGAASRLPFGF